MAEKDIAELIEKSRSTDVILLVRAKEKAKQRVNEDPTAANLAALERASALLERARGTQALPQSTFQKPRDVLEYLEGQGRKTGKSQLYKDIRAGRLSRGKDGTFALADVERYALTRPLVSMPEKAAEEIADLAEQKLREEARRIRAIADREEFDLQIRRGKYLPRSDVYRELAGRLVVLTTSLKTAYEARMQDIIARAGGDSRNAQAVLALLCDIQDQKLDEYSRPMEFEVEIPDEGG